jgi:hypothetical protein
MKKFTGILACALIVILSSCSNERTKSKLIFSYDNEDNYWSPNASVVKFADAHSGNSANKINKQNPYSGVFDIKANEISAKRLQYAKISAWFLMTGNNSEQNLVFDVRDAATQKSYEWISKDAMEFAKGMNQWCKVTLEVDLRQAGRGNLDRAYRIYACNGKDDVVYVDDFEIEFED